jgi:RNA polymerase sigma factor (sigma-70 family)
MSRNRTEHVPSLFQWFKSGKILAARSWRWLWGTQESLLHDTASVRSLSTSVDAYVRPVWERTGGMGSGKQEELVALARRVAEGRDRMAFVELFDHFAPRLNGYLQRLGLERGDAEDMVQEVMTVLWHKAHLFDPSKSSLATWVFRIARNRRIDAARRERSRVLDPDEPMLMPTEPEAVDDELDARRRDERVRAALSVLPREQFELVQMAFFLGLSHSQIAERSGLPLGTVKSRIRLAFQRMRRILEADELIDTDDETGQPA